MAGVRRSARRRALYVVERLRPLRARQEPGPRLRRPQPRDWRARRRDDGGERMAGRRSRAAAGRARGLGLLRRLPLPRALRMVLGFLLLDYTLYLWHRMNHRVPFLWRFHAVHHIDLDLDSTTGLRFHFGELSLAAGFRAAQVLLLGVDGGTLRVWQQMLVLSVIFHHSNLELPIAIERRLVRVRGHAADARHPSLDARRRKPTRTIRACCPAGIGCTGA